VAPEAGVTRCRAGLTPVPHVFLKSTMPAPLRKHLHASLLASVLALVGCAGEPARPMPTVAHVDLPRFMGDWYVIANIPTFIEKGAHNAVESYQLALDGTIETTFTFRAGGFDGEPRRYQPHGFVLDRQTNALWGIQFIWPVKADYRIVYLADDYSQTVVARAARDYVWIMARRPTISDADYQHLVDVVARQGYDVSQLQRVPQRWPSGAPG
jgi:apolipoprotein D and lipocalin family protein